MTCKRCTQEHSPKAWKLAVIITNGRNLTRTDWGEKTVCGLAAMIDAELSAPEPAPRPTKPPQWWIDNNTDGAGHCFTDADDGL